MTLVDFAAIVFISLFCGLMVTILSFLCAKDGPRVAENALFDGSIFGIGVFVGSLIFTVTT